MRAVSEFGHALVTPLGAPKGRVSTYTEVQFKDSAGKTAGDSSHDSRGASMVSSIRRRIATNGVAPGALDPRGGNP